MPVMIDAFDAQGLIVVWNHECERVTGYTAKEILRNPKAMEMLYPNATYREQMMWQWHDRGDDYYNWEWKMTARDGSVKTVLWSNISAQFPIPGWAAWGIGVDITTRDEAQQQLEAYHAKMARTEQLASVGTLSATLAHGLSQDLTAVCLPIQNAVAALAPRDDLEDAKSDLEEACVAISKILSRVAQVKMFSRRSWQDSVQYVALDEICERIVTLLGSVMERVRLTVHVECTGEPLKLWANESDIEQLFFSLIENCIQAADTDRDNQLSIGISRDDRQFQLRFSDNGAGIAPEHLEKVFDPFFTTKPPNVGTGLGLFIVKNIVERARGTIQLESRPHEGTTATVVLPLRTAAEISSLTRGSSSGRTDQQTMANFDSLDFWEI
jgi:PAS domain S-box-containing protein